MAGVVALGNAEKRLPPALLAKAVMSGSAEYGWREVDFSGVMEAAVRVPMAVTGGQIQYILPDGTCELYWLNYDPDERKPHEIWPRYCIRTAKECLDLFTEIISSVSIEKEALNSFEFLREKAAKGIEIADYKTFIIYFDDSETDSYLK